MRLEFSSKSAEYGSNKDAPTTLRLQTDLLSALRALAKIENDSVTNLLTEGAIRVIEDRMADDNYPNSVIEQQEDVPASATGQRFADFLGRLG